MQQMLPNKKQCVLEKTKGMKKLYVDFFATFFLQFSLEMEIECFEIPISIWFLWWQVSDDLERREKERSLSGFSLRHQLSRHQGAFDCTIHIWLQSKGLQLCIIWNVQTDHRFGNELNKGGNKNWLTNLKSYTFSVGLRIRLW